MDNFGGTKMDNFGGTKMDNSIGTKMRDKYDDAVKYFLSLNKQEFRDEVSNSWSNPSSKKAGCLFQYMTPTGELEDGHGNYYRVDEKLCGCITQIKYGHRHGINPELDLLIKNDPDVPSSPGDVTKKNIYVFPKYQRLADIMIRSSPVVILQKRSIDE